MTGSAIRRYFSGLSRDTCLLSGASLFADMSTEMLSPVLPVFLTHTLGASGSIVGLVDGVAQATRNIVDGFAGSLSDKFRVRKPIVLMGLGLAAIAKPMMGLSPIWQGVLAARLLDRFAAGVRSAPRDALVAASVDRTSRGQGFGLESLGDNAGAFLGPMLALLLVYAVQVEIRTIFYLAAIPAVLAVITAVALREKTAPRPPKRAPVNLRGFPRRYWKYLLATALFGVGNSSDSFLILRTQDLGASLEISILIYAVSNLVGALVAYPAGLLSDRYGRKGVLLGSFIVFVVVYGGFALSGDLLVSALLFAFYGFHQGMFRAAGKTCASDLVPEHLRASGIGWYSTTVGLLQLVASLVAGLLWDHSSHASVFAFGAGAAVLGSIGLIVLVRPEAASPRP